MCLICSMFPRLSHIDLTIDRGARSSIYPLGNFFSMYFFISSILSNMRKESPVYFSRRSLRSQQHSIMKTLSMVNRGNIYGIFFKSTRLSGSLGFIMISYSKVKSNLPMSWPRTAKKYVGQIDRALTFLDCYFTTLGIL